MNGWWFLTCKFAEKFGLVQAFSEKYWGRPALFLTLGTVCASGGGCGEAAEAADGEIVDNLLHKNFAIVTGMQ